MSFFCFSHWLQTAKMAKIHHLVGTKPTLFVWRTPSPRAPLKMRLARRSFVKNSRKYYDDCATLLSEYMCAAVKPKLVSGFSALDPLLSTFSTLIRPQTPQKKMSLDGSQSSGKDPRSALQRAFNLVSSEPPSPNKPGDRHVSVSSSSSSPKSANQRESEVDTEMMDILTRSSSNLEVSERRTNRFLQLSISLNL